MEKQGVVVLDIRTLNRLEKEGHIELHPQTGNKVKTLWGKSITCVYIKGTGDNDNKPSSFVDSKGIRYRVEYRSGSFYPYVFCYGKA